MKLGWYKRQISPTEFAFYYINSASHFIEGFILWPDEKFISIISNLSRTNFEDNFLSSRNGFESDTVFYDNNFYYGLVKISFECDDYFISKLYDNIDDILGQKNETL